MSWEIVDNHRRKVRAINFNILIWGPSKVDNELYEIRFKIKTELDSLGHSAKFSEDLIIVLYKSRGTQTEIDRILNYEKLANKSLIFAENETFIQPGNSLSKYTWKGLERFVKKVDKYEFEEIFACILEFIENLQFVLAAAAGIIIIFLSFLTTEVEEAAGLWQRLMFNISFGWMIYTFKTREYKT